MNNKFGRTFLIPSVEVLLYDELVNMLLNPGMSLHSSNASPLDRFDYHYHE